MVLFFLFKWFCSRLSNTNKIKYSIRIRKKFKTWIFINKWKTLTTDYLTEFTDESDPFNIEALPSLNYKFVLKDGIVRVLNQNGTWNDKIVYVDLRMFLEDYYFMVNWVDDDLL